MKDNHWIQTQGKNVTYEFRSDRTRNFYGFTFVQHCGDIHAHDNHLSQEFQSNPKPYPNDFVWIDEVRCKGHETVEIDFKEV